MLHNFIPCVKEAGYSMEQFRNSAEVMAECFINASKRYGADAILTDVDTALLAGACGAKVVYPKDKPAVVDHQDDIGIDALVKRIASIDILENKRINEYLKAIRLISEWCGDRVFLRGNADQGPFALAFQLYGMERFLMDLMDEEKEEAIFELIEICGDASLTLHKAVYKAGAHCTSYGDSASGPSVVSPDIYRKFSLPYQKRLAKALAKDRELFGLQHVQMPRS
jgi:uroporphyrinogen decarboxylase